MLVTAQRSVTLLLAEMACLGVICLAPSHAAEAPGPIKFSGAIVGAVRNPAGIGQMGATVLLFNRQQRQIGKVLTNERGEFKLLGLVPASYFVKVSLAAFAPATRQILVQPGMRSILNVKLSALWSTIQFAYPPVANGSFMTDDWKWVLRSAASTRPVLRFTDIDPLAPPPSAPRGAVFSETRGLVQVSAGEGAVAAAVGNQADLGTAFALATSIYGNSSLEVSGNVGYGSSTGVPTAAFRTSYSREMGGGAPEISVTVRQVMLPGRYGSSYGGSDALLRTIAAGIDDDARIADNVTVQYGISMDSVSFVDHLNYYSPYARLTYALDDDAQLVFAYSAGNARPGLESAAPESNASAEGNALERDIGTLGYFPRLSVAHGRPHIQRGQDYEIAYIRKAGSRTYRASVYRQDISDAALTMVAPSGMFEGSGDVLPDLFSGTSVFNAGKFQSTGYNFGVTQKLNDNLSAAAIYGDTGALSAATGDLVSNSPDELRAMIRAGRRHTVTMRFTATAPRAGTHLIASYQWTSGDRALMTGNIYSTDSFQPMPGMNLCVRQPIPGFGRRIEATADLRNLLAQGYLPLDGNGQRILLVENPRSVRGGLNFVF